MGCRLAGAADSAGQVQLKEPWLQSFNCQSSSDLLWLLSSSCRVQQHCPAVAATCFQRSTLVVVIDCVTLCVQVGKLVYCTRTVPEMEKVLAELQVWVNHRCIN